MIPIVINRCNLMTFLYFHLLYLKLSHKNDNKTVYTETSSKNSYFLFIIQVSSVLQNIIFLIKKFNV